MKKTFILVFLVLGFLLSACSNGQPEINLETTQFDFGDLVNGVIASRDFLVSNTGQSDLVIGTVTTTCGCTTASLEPMTIPPGGEGLLKINFDSGAHGPHLTGEVMRRVILVSNDPNQPESTVDFVANILSPDSQ